DSAPRYLPALPTRRSSDLNWLIKNFLRGLVIVVPIAITIYLVVEAFVRIDRLLQLRTPGLGFAVTIVLIVAIGALATNIVGRTRSEEHTSELQSPYDLVCR